MWGRGQLFCLCLAVVVLFAVCFWWLLWRGEGGVVWGVGGEGGYSVLCVCTNL